ncbi:MAG TPA: DUF4446 family protein [Candidatus Cybelea sp.]|jgi:hypothetical protein|nr:DUF4446 family protein [Candidatus Cybelea sp.]
MMQQLSAFYAAIAAFAGACVVLAIYHAMVVRPRLRRDGELLAVHDELISGGSSGAADRLGALESASGALRGALEGLAGRTAALEALAGTDLSRCGFVRYDAFRDSGDGLSYALALLNRQGDGVVITSIYSRNDTRTFGKPVAAFIPTIAASTEELEAIERARVAVS